MWPSPWSGALTLVCGAILVGRRAVGPQLREARHDANSWSPALRASSAARWWPDLAEAGHSVRAAMRQPADVFARSGPRWWRCPTWTRPVGEWRALLRGIDTVVHLGRHCATPGAGIAEETYDRVNRLATADRHSANTAKTVRLSSICFFISSIRAQSGPFVRGRSP